MEDLTVLVASAALVRAIQTEGIIRLENDFAPEVGSHPSFTEKRIIIIRPIQKFGIDIPAIATVETVVSIQVFCFTEARIPKTRETTIVITSAATAKRIVYGNLPK